MSIKRKMATALATAGLLAGIFGSTLAPVAQAGGVDKGYIKAELLSNAYGGYDANADHKGTTADPFVIYAPLVNDGSGNDPMGYSDDPVCVQADETYFEDTAGNDLHDDGDEIAIVVSATNGLGLYVEDTDSGSYETAESYWKTGSVKLDDISDGLYVCMAPFDDDDAYNSVVTITVRGTTVATLNVAVVGPATGITPVSYIGTWVAESNDYIYAAAALSFTDKAGHNIRTYLKTIGGVSATEAADDIIDYAKTGYSSDSSQNTLEFYVDDVSNGDAPSSDLTTTAGIGSIAAGDIKYVDMYEDF